MGRERAAAGALGWIGRCIVIGVDWDWVVSEQQWGNWVGWGDALGLGCEFGWWCIGNWSWIGFRDLVGCCVGMAFRGMGI